MDIFNIMIRDQLSLFETETHINNVYITDKPVDVSTLLPEDDVIKDRYFIYPNNGKHPYADFDKRLNTKDFPFVEDRDSRFMKKKKVLHVVVRDRISYPYVMLAKNSTRQSFYGKPTNEQKAICIHKLAGRAFLDSGNLDPYHNSTVVDHIDNKTWNYKLNNLRFVTRSENAKGCLRISKQEIFEIAKKNRRF